MGPGIHRLTADQYHADPAPEPSLSSSLARLIYEHSPLHAWRMHPKLNPDYAKEEAERKANRNFDIGRAAHRRVLGAGAEFVVIPQGYLASNGAASTKEAKQYIADAREAGVTAIKPDDAELIDAMGRKLAAALGEMGTALDPAQSEVVALARIDDVWCRCMVDNAQSPGLPLVDFKTTTDASRSAVERAIGTYGYDVQAAHYLDVWEAATGEKRRFRFVFQEKEPPFEVTVCELDRETIDMARRVTRRARDVWGMCLRESDWPGYPRVVNEVSLPPYRHTTRLERESAEDAYRQTYGNDIIRAVHEWNAPHRLAGE